MNANDILRFIGLARKAGHLEIGEEPVASAVRSHAARLFLVASDATDNTARRARHFQETGKTVLFRLPYTKEELGESTGHSACALLALTDIGFASSLADKLELFSPDQYGEGAAQLRTQLKNAVLRRRERERHEKKQKPGKRLPGREQ
jgi:ribosomal protein L7Ae-like RNA K-turn-binding protein